MTTTLTSHMISNVSRVDGWTTISCTCPYAAEYQDTAQAQAAFDEHINEMNVEAEAAWSQTVSHEGWHAVKGSAPCDNCTPEERVARS